MYKIVTLWLVLCSRVKYITGDVILSKSHDTIISQYEVHDTIFIAIFKKKRQIGIFFKVKLFYLVHFESQN